MLRSNHGVCFDWNALIATAETTNKLSFRIKTALFTDLRYFLPLVEGSCWFHPKLETGLQPEAH